MYHAFWADWYLPAALPALETLFFSKVRRGASVLDVCCGSGHVTKELVARDYAVTGVDLSAALIAQARQQLPQAAFQVQDVRKFSLEQRFDAALSTFDSFNHFLSLADLRSAFASVHRHLKSGCLFVFDMNSEQAYFVDLRQWAAMVSENNVGLVRGTYDRMAQTASTELIWFERKEQSTCWKQRRSVVKQRCYSQEDILSALAESGFKDIEAIPATNAGVTSDLGFGRIFFSARA